MRRIGFTKEERELIDACARDNQSAASRAGSYGSVLVPVLIFGVYGFVNRDVVAISVALFGLIIFVWWRLSYEFSKLAVYQSLFQKLLRYEQEGDFAEQAKQSNDAASSQSLD